MGFNYKKTPTLEYEHAPCVLPNLGDFKNINLESLISLGVFPIRNSGYAGDGFQSETHCKSASVRAGTKVKLFTLVKCVCVLGPAMF